MKIVPNRLRYNGQMADGLTGLYYLRARYYNASLGRFTQEDVIYKYQSQGLYSEIRPKLQEYIKQCKELMPELFDK